MPTRCFLSFLKWMLSVLVQIPLPEETVWNLQSCGHWNINVWDFSWHILLKVNAHWAFFSYWKSGLKLYLFFFFFFCSASNGLYTLMASGSTACIIICKSNISKEEIAGMWLVEAFFRWSLAVIGEVLRGSIIAYEKGKPKSDCFNLQVD